MCTSTTCARHDSHKVCTLASHPVVVCSFLQGHGVCAWCDFSNTSYWQFQPVCAYVGDVNENKHTQVADKKPATHIRHKRLHDAEVRTQEFEGHGTKDKT
jgi:hypothetical protein